MRASKYFLATEKEAPADAEIVSHKLLIRAGLIRKVSSGIYSYLPTGLKVLHKIEAIVREEMDRSGALEILMPMVQPAEYWLESNRYNDYGDNLLKFKDRKASEFVLAPTAEEVVTDISRNNINSYRQLPINLYQFQTKFRDETRPRFGLLRTREFIMKDAYSFHATQASLEEEYVNMYNTYKRIFNRLGLKFVAVEADNGDIGGKYSHEFQILAEIGEDTVVYCPESDYAANIEKATYKFIANCPAPTQQMIEEYTPQVYTINDLLAYKPGFKIENTIKLLVVRGVTEDKPVIALALRGDHQLNEIKAAKHPLIQSPLEFVSDDEIKQIFKASPGSLGVVNCPIPLIADLSATNVADFSTGANKDDYHFFGVNWQRDANYLEAVDLRNVVVGDPSPDGKGELKTTKGIEVGHVFALGTFYSEAMKAYVQNETGTVDVHMGCYGIGVSRIIAAAIEQSHDEKGIIWPRELAPFSFGILALNYHKSERVKAYCDKLYEELRYQGIDVFFDDRSERMGSALADLDLIGIPHLLIVGEKNLDQGLVEYKARQNQEKTIVEINKLHSFIAQIMHVSVDNKQCS